MMSKYSLGFDPPIMNAAGSLGFAPDLHGPVDLKRLGAFITNPISGAGRSPAHGMRFAAYVGGFLVHTGHPNPGLKIALRRHAAQWRRSVLPVWVHLLAQDADTLARMVRTIEGIEGIAGIEIGLGPDVSAESAFAFVAASQVELPVLARLPMERALELAEVVSAAGASAISLGPPRGAVSIAGNEILQGRMYGPAVLPLALAAVQSLIRSGFNVIGAGGIYRQEDMDAMLAAGATAVQLDAALWLGF
jgi:dihydroorotate dehydrogenase (NAD+) catalytic subunit